MSIHSKAAAMVKEFFHQWDTGGIPLNLAKNKKDDLIALLEGYRKNPPTAGRKPKIKELAKILLTSEDLDTLTKEELVSIIHEAFNSRGLRCKITSVDWYPSDGNFRAVPRRTPSAGTDS